MSGGATDWVEWLPIRVWRAEQGWSVDWCRFGQQPLRESFFKDSVDVALRSPFNLAFRRRTGIGTLLDWQSRRPGVVPTAFVFHTSRCGSTLLAQMLARLDSHTVLSEPPPLDSLLRAHYDEPAVADHQVAWIRALLSAFGQRRRGSERALVVKLDAWNIFELPLLRQCFPDAPCLFLYREPLEVAVSHLHAPGRHMVPSLLGSSPLAIGDDEAAPQSRPAFIARRLQRLLAAGLEGCTRHGAIPVNYAELPQAVGERLAPLLGLAPAEAALAMGGAWPDSKRVGMTFQADSDRKQQSAEPATRAQVEQWARAPYTALEALRLRLFSTIAAPA